MTCVYLIISSNEVFIQYIYFLLFQKPQSIEKYLKTQTQRFITEWNYPPTVKLCSTLLCSSRELMLTKELAYNMCKE